MRPLGLQTYIICGWLGGVEVRESRLAIERSPVRLPAIPLPGSLGQLSLPG